MMNNVHLWLGYLRHPQRLNRFSLNIPAFFLLLCAIAYGATCGDGNCYYGYNTSNLEVSFNGSSGSFFVNSSRAYSINGSDFTVEIDSYTSTSLVVSIGGSTERINKGSSKELGNYSVKVVDIMLNVDSEIFNCSEDCDECNSSSECDDDDMCTSDTCSGTPKRCVNEAIAGCDDESFYELGDAFSVGSDYCRENLVFKEVYNGSKTLIFGRPGDDDINASYSTDSNQYGYKVILKIEKYNILTEYILRYDAGERKLYIEQGDTECPMRDECNTTADCDDDDACTIDVCTGQPQKCGNRAILWCKDDDGCCPKKCSKEDDSDCVPEEMDECTSNEDCDDRDKSTKDTCSGMPKKCLYTPITECLSGDDFCPINCSHTNDNDCEVPAVCGDSKCEKNETKENCCGDCGCNEGYECSDNACKKTAETMALEAVEADPKFNVMEEKIVSKGFTLYNKEYARSDDGFKFSYTYKNIDKETKLEGKISSEGEVELKKASSAVLMVLGLLFLIGAVIIIILAVASKKDKEKLDAEKEKYYQKLLQMKYQNNQQQTNNQYRNR